MARLIDADVLKNFLHEEDFGTPDERWKPESEFAAMIDFAPTVDAALVVRCKNCRHSESYYPVKAKGEEYYPLEHRCMMIDRVVRPEHFCSYGERRVSE